MRALAVVLVLTSLVACKKSGPQPPASGVGTLPPGCTLAGAFDRSGPVGLDGILSAVRGPQTGGAPSVVELELKRRTTRALYCKMTAGAGRPAFVAALEGEWPADVFDQLARAVGGDMHLERETVGDKTIYGRGRSWSALRTGRVGSSDVVIASDRELLLAALNGPAGAYAFDEGRPVSLFISGAALAARHKQANREPSQFSRVRSVTLSLRPDAAVVDAKLSIGDRTESERVAEGLPPALAELVRLMARVPMTRPQVSARAEGGDVLASVVLPPGSVDALAAQLGKVAHPASPLSGP